MKTVAERVAAHKPSIGASAIGSLWPLVVGFAIAYVLHAAVAPLIGPFYAKLVLDIGIAIIAAGSLNIVNGFGGQFSIGHAGFMMVGGYAAAWLTYYGSIALWGSADVHGGFLGGGDLLFLAACLLGGTLAALVGVVVGLPSLRLRGDYLAIVTLGFGEIARVIVQQTSEVQYADVAKTESLAATATHLGGSLGFGGIPTYTRIFWVYVFVTILLVAAYRLKASSKGRQLLAVRENEIAAEAMGIQTSRVKVTSFVMSAYFAGIGGALFAHELGTTLNPRELGFQKSIDLVIIVVLGGIGSISGAVVAAAILTIMPELFREFSDYRMPIYALALIVVMILRPQGLFGISELWETRWWRRLMAKLDDQVADAARDGRDDHEGQVVSEPYRDGEAAKDEPRKLALEASKLSIAFGGLKAVTELSIALPERALHGLIGPNGAGKTTAFNLLTGVYQARHRHDPTCAARTSSATSRRRSRARASRARSRTSGCSASCRCSTTCAPPAACARRAGCFAASCARRCTSPRSERDRRARDGSARHARHRPPRVRAGEELAVRRSAQARDRARARDRAERAAARRAGRGHEHEREARHARHDRQDPRGVRRRGPAHRARHGPRHGDLRAHHRARSRRHDRGGQAGRDPGRSQGHRGVPRRARRSGSRVVSAPLLQVTDLDVHYGGIHALKGASFAVEAGQVVTLIGANGAGKTTTLRAISGLVQSSAGRVVFDGADITRLPAHEIVARGLSHVPEGRGIFSNLTVDENLQLGGFLRRDPAGEAKDRKRALELFPRLGERLAQSAGTLSGGEQQMLAIARALIARPKLLMLDEPSLGLAPQVVAIIFQIVKTIVAEGTTILLVEQNAHMALRVAQYAHVLEVGTLVQSGPAAELSRDDKIRKAYLGVH